MCHQENRTRFSQNNRANNNDYGGQKNLMYLLFNKGVAGMKGCTFCSFVEEDLFLFRLNVLAFDWQKLLDCGFVA